LRSLDVEETIPAMTRASTLFLAAATGLGALFTVRGASALGPIDVEVAARVGGGGKSNPNTLGFGLGARAGASFSGFYGGLSLMYYFGAGENFGYYDVGTQASASAHESWTSLLYGIEGGYNFRVSSLTVRPQVGVGNITQMQTLSGPEIGQTTSASSLYFEPGVTALLSLGSWVFGADANLLFTPGLPGAWVGATAHGQVGIAF
jgi:hypothetical protein